MITTMTDYWKEQLEMTSAIEGFSEAMRRREEAERATIRREAMAQGYREGVSDGLKAAARVCEGIAGASYNADPSGDIQRCADAIRALIDQKPPEAG